MRFAIVSAAVIGGLVAASYGYYRWGTRDEPSDNDEMFAVPTSWPPDAITRAPRQGSGLA